MRYLNNMKNNFNFNNDQMNLINPIKGKFSNNDDISSINTKENFNFNGNENDNGFNRNYVEEATTNIIDDFPDYNNKKEELFKKYENMNSIEQNYKNNAGYNLFNNSNKNKQNIAMPKSKNSTNINQLSKKNVKKNYNNENNNMNKYELEINKLKQEIESLENSNEILSNQLKEEEKRNEELNIIKNEKEENDNSILSDISHCLQVNSFEEILPKLNEMINFLNQYNNDQNVKIKEELISKLKSLYISSNNSHENKENITIQDLWRWIKNLINNVRQLSVEKEKNAEFYNNNNYTIYKKYCEKLIQEFNLNSFDELKIFIDDLLAKNNVNKKRVEKLRKVLMNSRDKEDYSSNEFNNEKNDNNINEGGYEKAGQEMEAEDVGDISNNNDINYRKINKNDYYNNNINDYNLNYNYDDN